MIGVITVQLECSRRPVTLDVLYLKRWKIASRQNLIALNASTVMLLSNMCFYIDISGQPVLLNYAHSNLFRPWRTSINSKNIPQRKL
jgi:hypothetical protein